MGQFTTGIGLFSGVNSAQLIDQLLAIEARPKQALQARVVNLQAQRAAFLDINSSLLGLRSAAQRFRIGNVFKSAQAVSSNPDVLTATAGTTASAGSYQFLVRRLVSSHQVLSRAFTDANSSAVGATSFTFEVGGGGLATDTRLAELNGGAGVARGKIIITDAAGGSATVDLSTAVTVGDVLEAINSATGVRVSATVDGDRIRITDMNTSGSGTLTISNAAGYTTAASLGIAGSASAGFGQAITGSRIRTLSGASALSILNDGAGVNIRDGGPDLLITDREGTVHNIDLGLITQTTDGQTTVVQTRATTIQDVINYINAQTQGKVTAAINADGTGLVLTDTTGGSGNLIVRNGVNNRTTATDLGIETGESGVAASTVQGRRLIAGLNSVLVSSLNGGVGLSADSLTITDRAGTVTAVTISAAALAGSIHDVIKSINDQLSAGGNGVRVGLNRAGNGLALTDSLSGGSGDIAASGAAAEALGIETGAGAGGAHNGSNLQARWIGRATLLSSLNGGRGIGTGTFRITDAAGGTATITVSDSLRTVDDLIQFINGVAGIDVEASINATGDGVVIRDTSGGSNTLRIEDVAGTTAKSLNLVGQAQEEDGVIAINGSYERTVSFSATDTLNTVASKINSAGAGVSAAVIRDGSGFRLSLTSLRSGAIGRLVIDTGTLDLSLSTLSRGDDAVAFFGAGDPAGAVLLTSSSNTLDNVVQGVSIDLRQTSASPVELVVSRDTAAVEQAVGEFVAAYNAVIDKLGRYASFNRETEQATILFGDQTIGSIRSTLLRTVQGTPQGVSGGFQRLFQIGVRVGAGSKLEFDRTRFRSAMEQDPQAVEDLLAARDTVPQTSTVVISEPGEPEITVAETSSTTEFTRLGIAEQLAEFAARSTNNLDGTLTRRGRSIDDQIRAQQSRIASMDERLASKRQRLERQFAGMERAIAALQAQSSALSSVSAIRLR